MVNILSDTFEKVLSNRKDRQAGYHQWSERAVVVGYDSRTQSYDLVITSGFAPGEGAQVKLNQTIRKVKSVIPAEITRFAAGDAVLVGYVGGGRTAEAREHPVILGASDNVVDRPAKVKLGGGTVLSSLTGQQPINFATPTAGTQTCFCEVGTTQTELKMEACIGATDFGNIDCSADSPQFQATVCGGVPPYAYSVEPPDAEVQVSGIAGNNVTIIPPVSTHSDPSTINAYSLRSLQTCVNSPASPPILTVSDCKDFDCDGNEFPSFPPCFGDTEPCGEGTKLIGSCGVCGNNIVLCGRCPEYNMDQPIGCFTYNITRRTCVLDTRSQENIDDGCKPCAATMDGTIVTVTDSEGNQVSIVMVVI